MEGSHKGKRKKEKKSTPPTLISTTFCNIATAKLFTTDLLDSM
jgi:hypothetical protein